ncbi:TetR/AcrR family transcriptional regulator [Micromonospora sp. DSM 115977]|uniref:TetR/AcrR family transcriptional regulator n=1 Tax=Micromonospora reichwaldensis TaxID=3075516 RepID=A0ABU2WTK4_9ACTN|nr:TetR/AcrR family transcriptional regulator [Micromonospora sp. DSM 115977]MDT0529244.1 TetR/AcrR family transcriptional regulator [Micromonospora sp. DSM 115977]
MVYRSTERVKARLSASRERIIAAALEIMAEHGYAGCSVAAVAERAGMATGSVYRHFPTKADLVAEVFRTASRREVDAVARAAALEGTVAERVTAVIETFSGRALRSPRLAYALLAEPADPAVDAERLVFRRAYAELIAGHVAQGVASGELPPQDPELTATALVGALAEAMVGPLAAGVAGPRTIEHLITFLHRALGVSP